MMSTDPELIQQIVKGSAEAFATLFERYEGSVRSRLLRIVRDDAGTFGD